MVANQILLDKTQLYEDMILSEKMAYEAQDRLLDEIKKWFSKVLSEDVADYTKIILAQGGYIQIRTIEELNEEQISAFSDDFNFEMTWTREELMTDFRNVETVSAKIYEYAFIPKNIQEIMGDNQVEMGE